MDRVSLRGCSRTRRCEGHGWRISHMDLSRTASETDLRRADPSPFLSNLLLFGHALRHVGITVSLTQTVEAARALELVDIGSRGQVYHALRSLLINRREDLLLFDQVFNQFWQAPEPLAPKRTQKMPVAPRYNLPRQEHLNLVSLMAQKAQLGDPEVDVADKSGSFSAIELLQRKEFSQMTPEELATVKRLI